MVCWPFFGSAVTFVISFAGWRVSAVVVVARVVDARADVEIVVVVVVHGKIIGNVIHYRARFVDHFCSQ